MANFQCEPMIMKLLFFIFSENSFHFVLFSTLYIYIYNLFIYVSVNICIYFYHQYD